MVLTKLFKKITGKDSREEKVNQIYSALIDGLNEMDRYGAERVILTAYETEPSKNATGKWIQANKLNYYPFEMLSEVEKELIRGEKHYFVITLVKENVGGIVKFPGEGVEASHRTHLNPLLPKLKPESNLKYFTEGGVYIGEDIKKFAESVVDSGWDAQIIPKVVRAGIQEYSAITKRLFHTGGVYAALEKMDQRNHSPLEGILSNMRDNITNAKKR